MVYTFAIAKMVGCLKFLAETIEIPVRMTNDNDDAYDSDDANGFGHC